MSDRNAHQEALNVSRETFKRFEILADLLNKWNPKINLVAKSTLGDLWTRHILDSTQVFGVAPTVDHWVDIGSGGGFPGLVVALMAAEEGAPKRVTLIESDQRKCAFLRTVLRECGVQATVLAKRIEQAEPQNADLLSARALADLSLLFEFSDRHLNSEGVMLFPKGVNWKKEVDNSQKSWSFSHEAIKSKTEAGAVILKIGELHRV